MVFRQLLENHCKPCIELVLFQIFMILPLGIIYILGNIIFQVGVKNSLKNFIPCDECWSYTNLTAHTRYFNVFKLVDWYRNPLLWVGIFCLLQALSHIFERKYTNQVSVKLRIPWLPEVFLSQSNGIGEEKPLVQAFENLTSMPRLIDIEKTSNLMHDITHQSASLVPTVHSSYLF